jgi:hypothetical protein
MNRFFGFVLAGLLALTLAAAATGPARAASVPAGALTNIDRHAAGAVEKARYRRGYHGPRHVHGPRFYGGPRFYRGPVWRGPVYRGPLYHRPIYRGPAYYPYPVYRDCWRVRRWVWTPRGYVRRWVRVCR